MNSENKTPPWVYALIGVFLVLTLLIVMRRDVGKAHKRAEKRRKKEMEAIAKEAEALAEQAAEEVAA